MLCAHTKSTGPDVYIWDIYYNVWLPKPVRSMALKAFRFIHKRVKFLDRPVPRFVSLRSIYAQAMMLIEWKLAK